MTIVVAVATPEGLVMGSDSRSTYDMGDHHRNVSDNAQKLFTVGQMGVATFGLAFIGDDTIAGVMDQFAAQVGDNGKNVHDFGVALAAFFSERFETQRKTEGRPWDAKREDQPLGFVVAGYDGDGIGHIKEVMIPGAEIDEELSAKTTNGGTMWRGHTDAIGRLIKGIDLLRLEGLQITLTPNIKKEIRRLEYQPMLPITIQDGIDYVAFLVRTTIDMERFSDGTVMDPRSIPVCGGPLQVLAIERGGPSWISPLTLQAPAYSSQAEGASAP